MKLLLAMIITSALCGRTAPERWDYVGEGTFKTNSQRPLLLETFALTSNLKRMPDHHVQVKMKGFLASDMNARSLRERIKRNSRHHNFASDIEDGRQSRKNISLETKRKISHFEFLVNNVRLIPRMEVLLEFDCVRKLARTLSVKVQNAGLLRTDKKPSEWAIVEPEGLGAHLHAVACP
jgi:hypothetical protein